MTKVSMHHQIYIVKQMNVCGGYNGDRGDQKHNEKYGENCQTFISCVTLVAACKTEQFVVHQNTAR